MAKDQASGAGGAQRGRTRSGRTPVPPSTAAPTPRKKRTSPAQFFREVRAEGRKITWTSRKETWITSVMVFVMVGLAVLFFWLIDGLLGFLVNQVLRIGS